MIKFLKIARKLSYTACGGYGSVPHCPWRVRKCSMPLVEGVDGLQAACRGRGRAPCCLSRAWNCSTLPVEGMNLFKAAIGGHGSVPCCPWRVWKWCCRWSFKQLKAVELEPAQSGSKWLKVAWSSLKWLEVAQCGSKRLDAAQSSSNQPWSDWNGIKWAQIGSKQV